QRVGLARQGLQLAEAEARWCATGTRGRRNEPRPARLGGGFQAVLDEACVVGRQQGTGRGAMSAGAQRDVGETEHELLLRAPGRLGHADGGTEALGAAPQEEE